MKLIMRLFSFIAALLGCSAATDPWVNPRGLPKGHNGGFREKLTTPVAGVKPHIVLILFDDYGLFTSLVLLRA